MTGEENEQLRSTVGGGPVILPYSANHSKDDQGSSQHQLQIRASKSRKSQQISEEEVTNYGDNPLLAVPQDKTSASNDEWGSEDIRAPNFGGGYEIINNKDTENLRNTYMGDERKNQSLIES